MTEAKVSKLASKEKASKSSLPNELDEKNDEVHSTAELLKPLYNSTTFSDCAFVVGSKKTRFHGHRVLIALRSTELGKICMEAAAKEKDKFKPVEITLTEADADVFSVFLSLCYADECTNLTGKNLPEVMAFAKKYGCPDLTLKCTEFLDQHVTPADCVQLLTGSSGESKEILSVIAEHADEIIDAEDFVTLPEKSLIALISHPSLSSEEKSLFDACVKWAIHQLKTEKAKETGAEIAKKLKNILPHIRFPLMNSSDLTKIASLNILPSSEMVALMTSAVSSSKSLKINQTKYLSTPRLCGGISRDKLLIYMKATEESVEEKDLTWLDQSGKNNNATAQSADTFPKLVSVKNGPKEFQVLRFDGVDDSLLWSSSASVSRPYTMFIVNRYYSEKAMGRTLQSQNVNFLMGLWAKMHGTHPNDWVYYSERVAVGDWFICASVGYPKQTNYFCNGIKHMQSEHGGCQPGPLCLNGCKNYIAEYSSSDVATVLVYERAMSDEEVLMTTRYLAIKYGVREALKTEDMIQTIKRISSISTEKKIITETEEKKKEKEEEESEDEEEEEVTAKVEEEDEKDEKQDKEKKEKKEAKHKAKAASIFKLISTLSTDSKVLEKIGRNAVHLIRSSEWLKLTKKELIYFVSNPHLYVSEYALYEACVEWAKAQLVASKTTAAPENIAQQLQNIVPHLRLTLFSDDQLATLALSKIVDSDTLVKLFVLKIHPEWNSKFSFTFDTLSRSPVSRQMLPLSGLITYLNATPSTFFPNVVDIKENKWLDLSGNGRHAVATNAKAFPKWISLSNGQKSFKAMRLDGTNTLLDIGDQYKYQLPFTVFIACRYYSVESAASVKETNCVPFTNSTRSRGRCLSSRDYNWLCGTWSGNWSFFSGDRSFPRQTAKDDVWVISCLMQSNTRTHYFVNGEKRSDIPAALSTSQPGRLSIPYGQSSTYHEHSHADIASIAIYDRVLSTDEVMQTTRYLANTMGLSMTRLKQSVAETSSTTVPSKESQDRYLII
eukprot:TRINITY_DN4015_c0_g1_i1.p1 TRINITY_DN4015_c0_g1~~TRINITY_DN4015_c0_g1_i1.p1  ORF type:complete len:1018 (+),score=288.71 TRINITY_DN4015_c0_g1_i1:39-3056(+)